MSPAHYFVFTGALLAGSGVALGAWGAHGLESHLGSSDTGAWDTAVLYQFIHALSLILLGLWYERHPGKLTTAAGWLFVIGVVLFSGSIYALTLDGPRWLGPITPLGGSAMLIGWGLFAASVWRRV